MICKDSNGEGVYHYQLQASYNIMQEYSVPLKFGKKEQSDRPMVYFVRKRNESKAISIS